MIPNDSETMRNVPSDCVRVVMSSAFPYALSRLTTSSVPSISPNAHCIQDMIVL